MISASDPERHLVEEAVKKRKIAKESKDYKAADRIREKLLLETGVELIDLADGTTYGRKKIE